MCMRFWQSAENVAQRGPLRRHLVPIRQRSGFPPATVQRNLYFGSRPVSAPAAAAAPEMPVLHV
jgi:hypothetical protein